MWRRWKAGYRMREIARALRCDHGSIRNLLAQRGGIGPSIRHRAKQALTLAEREDISRGIAADESARAIAARIGRAPSTVSREITRHGGRSSYRATEADKVAWESALRPKPCVLALNGTLRNIVARKLGLDWSPEQVAGWLKLQYPGNERMRVSHETIYRSLFIQARGVLKKELIRHLRTRRTLRHSRRAGAQDELRSAIARQKSRIAPSQVIGKAT
jgi:IS30 family transposase